jgi:glutamate carboxypeptidase
MIPTPILNLSEQKETLTALLISWCNQNSGSSHATGLEAMSGILAKAFADMPGAEVALVPLPSGKGPAVSVRMRPKAATQVLCSGHYDTVYPADHPFQACRFLEDARLRGPGVADMKGGLVVMLAALKAFEACPEARTIGWEVLITPDEETGSAASEEAIRAAAKRCTLGLVFEPARANGDLVRSRMGTGLFKVTCKGRAAHAAQIPNKGRNAIIALSEFLVAANRMPEARPGTLLNVGIISGGGIANVVPDHAEAVLNLRASTVADARAMEAELQSLAAPIRAREGYTLEITGAFERLPKECGPVEERLFTQYLEGADALGLPRPGWQHAGGGSDGNLLSEAGLPNLDGLGIIGENLHSDQETCSPDSLPQRAQLAALLLLRLASGT